MKNENESLIKETSGLLQKMNKVVDDLYQANLNLTKQVNNLSHPNPSAESRPRFEDLSF
jgi:uncharacterized protein YoxC